MSISRLWLFLAVGLPTLAALLAPMSAVDLAYQLRAGGEILDVRAVPSVDTWTFTAAGAPWIDQQWGAQAVLALAERLAGWTGLAIARGALTGTIFASLLFVARRARLNARSAALLTLAAFVIAGPSMALRPQLFGMACFATVLLLVSQRRLHPACLWLVPLVVAVWANLHGSFFLGPAVLGLAWLEDIHDRVARPNRTLVVAIVSALAACLTPLGPWVWVYSIGISTNPEVTARISEWQPTSIRDAPGILFFASALAVAALLARRGRKTSWPVLAWLAFFFVLGAYAQRAVAWWPLAAVPSVALLLGPPGRPSVPAVERSEIPLMRRLNLVVATSVVLACVALLPNWRPIDPRTGVPSALLTDAPPGITAALRDLSQPGDRVFNPQRWGSWFEYAVPEVLVAIDSRIEFFPPQVWEDYESVLSGRDGWTALLEAWAVEFVVTDRRQGALGDRLTAAGWNRAYADGDGAIYTTAD